MWTDTKLVNLNTAGKRTPVAGESWATLAADWEWPAPLHCHSALIGYHIATERAAVRDPFLKGSAVPPDQRADSDWSWHLASAGKSVHVSSAAPEQHGDSTHIK